MHLIFAGERRCKANLDAANKPQVKSKTAVSKTKYANAKSQNNPYSSDESDAEEYPDSYFQVPLQVCSLFYTSSSVATPCYYLSRSATLNLV